MDSYEIFTDGGSRGNPGPAACAAIIYSKGKKVIGLSKHLGIATNNQAEYQGVLLAFEWLKDHISNKVKVKFFLDSQLIVEQLTGNYKIRNQGLKPLYWKVKENIVGNNLYVDFEYIPREKNKLADKLLNDTLNRLKYSKLQNQSIKPPLKNLPR